LTAVSFTVVEGAEPAGFTSSDAGFTQTITLPLTGTCTAIYNYTAQGSLKIIKNTTGGNGTFTFTATGPSTVATQTIITSAGSGSVLVSSLTAGSYTVIEGAEPAGFTSNDAGFTQTITVPAGGTGTAIYNDTAQGSLKIIKNTTGGNGTFTFTATGPSTVATQTIITSAGSGSVLVSSLTAGSYTVIEGAEPAGFTSNDAGFTQTITVPVNGTGTAI
jgi:uncharacterized surface anchored protein